MQALALADHRNVFQLERGKLTGNGILGCALLCQQAAIDGHLLHLCLEGVGGVAHGRLGAFRGKHQIQPVDGIVLQHRPGGLGFIGIRHERKCTHGVAQLP